jgi:hypothetical protein
MPLPAEKGISNTRLWVELILTVVIAVAIFRRPPFLSSFFSWLANNIKLLMADPDWAGVQLLATGFAIALACLAAIAVHECGHVIAGMVLGFRFESIRFGRVRIDRGFHVSRHADSGEPTLGWAVMRPQHWDNIRSRTAIMVADGPLASLLSGYAVLSLLPRHGLISGSYIAVSFWFGLGNLLPLGLQGHPTDGLTIWMLLFNRDRSRRYMALLRMRHDIDRGVENRMLSPADLEEATHLRDESAETVVAHFFAYLAASSLHEHVRAEQMLEVALQYSGSTGPSMREMLAIQSAIVQAARRNRLDLAEQWLRDVPLTTPFLKLRSQVEGTIEKLRIGQSSPQTTADC